MSEAVAGPSLKGIKGQIEIDEWSNLWKRDKVRKSVHRGWRTWPGAKLFAIAAVVTS